MALATAQTPRSPDQFAFACQPGPAAMAGIARAAALMARADGRVDPAERAGLLRFLRRAGLLARHGRTAAVAAYEAELARQPSATEVLADLGAQRGGPAATLIARAAAHVATADGRLEPAEFDLLRRMQRSLGLAAQSERNPMASPAARRDA